MQRQRDTLRAHVCVFVYVCLRVKVKQYQLQKNKIQSRRVTDRGNTV